MTPKTQILAALTKLSQCKNANVSEAVLLTYCEMLEPYAIADVARACSDLAKERTFGFPQLGEIIELIESDQNVPMEVLAKEAWRAVLSACRNGGSYRDAVFQDPAMAEAVRISAGSWPNMCRLDTTTNEFLRIEKSFIELYAHYAKTAQHGEVTMRGLGTNRKTYTIGRVGDGLEPVKQIGNGYADISRELNPQEASAALKGIMDRVAVKKGIH